MWKKQARRRKKQIGRSKPVDVTSQKCDKGSGGLHKRVTMRIYQEKVDDVPFLDFLSKRKLQEQADIRAAIERLAQEGHELRPPLNEHLGGQIYYLRISSVDGSYRIFYWPYGKGVVILGHGFSKKTQKCPPKEIKRAKKQKERFLANPEQHTYQG